MNRNRYQPGRLFAAAMINAASALLTALLAAEVLVWFWLRSVW